MTYSKSPPSTNHFPWKLHDMLDDAEESNHSHIISWCADGKSFRIHQPNAMVTVLTQYFRQTKYKSLLRQLQGYDFKRVTSGSEKGNVSHPLFQRGQRDLCKDMKRKTNKIITKSPKYPTSKTRTEPLAKTGSNKESNRNSPKSATHNRSTGINPHPSKVISTSVRNTGNPKRVLQNPRPLPRTVSHGPVQPSSVTSSNCAQPMQISSSDSMMNSPMQRLESNFKCSLRDSLSHGQNSTAVLPVHNPIISKQSLKPVGMDALRVEIGYTFSAPTTKSDRSAPIGAKRNAPQQHLQGAAPASASAPTFENPRLTKRRRTVSSSLPSASTKGNSTDSFENASFSFSTSGILQSSIDKILQQENLELQKKRKEREFARLEKLCFSDVSQPGMQQFQHSVRASSNAGTMDLDIHLTTTTTTMNGKGDSHISSSTISNKFILPSHLEPTPIISPRKANPSREITLNCDIKIPSSEPPSLVLDLPVSQFSQGNTSFEVNSNRSQSQFSEVSDDIDEGIAEAFEDGGDDDRWKFTTFESDIEDDGDGKKKEEQDDWTKGVVYGGKTDCVLEPEKFQMEVQTMLSGSEEKPTHQVLNVQQSLPPQKNSYVQKLQSQGRPAIIQQQLAPQQIPNPLRHVSALQQTQRMPMGAPYVLLSRPMAFQRAFPTKIHR